MPSTLSTLDRFLDAAQSLADQGIIYTDLVDSCCRSCAMHESENPHEGEKPPISGIDGDFAWTFAGQGELHRWDSNGDPVLVEYDSDYDEDGEPIRRTWRARRTSPAESIPVYFGGDDSARVGRAVAEAFSGAGLTVEWNGDPNIAVRVVF